MAERRMISQDIRSSEDFWALASDSSRLLFVLCFANADRDGCVKAHPALLRADLAPLGSHTVEQVAEAIEEWVSLGLAVPFEDGKALYLTGFARAQRGAMWHREAPSKFTLPATLREHLDATRAYYKRSKKGEPQAPPPPKLEAPKKVEPIANSRPSRDEVATYSRPTHELVAVKERKGKERKLNEKNPPKVPQPALGPDESEDDSSELNPSQSLPPLTDEGKTIATWFRTRSRRHRVDPNAVGESAVGLLVAKYPQVLNNPQSLRKVLNSALSAFGVTDVPEPRLNNRWAANSVLHAAQRFHEKTGDFAPHAIAEAAPKRLPALTPEQRARYS